MAKTTDRQIVNGQEYMIMDSKAREDISEVNSNLNYAAEMIPQIIKHDLINRDISKYHKYYNNNSGTLEVISSPNAPTYIIDLPIHLREGVTYRTENLYRAFTFVCQRNTKTIIQNMAGIAIYTPEADCDMYVTLEEENINTAKITEEFTQNIFNTDTTLTLSSMPADSKAVGDKIISAERVYYAKDEPVTTSGTDDEKTSLSVDLSRPVYVEIKNTSTASGYFRPGIYVGDAWRYAGSLELLEAGGSYTWKLPSLQTNAEILWDWLFGAYFTPENVKLSLKNVNQRSAEITMYSNKKDEPIKENNSIYVSQTGGGGAFLNPLDAINYAKSQIDVSEVPVNIYVKPGVYIIKNIVGRLAVIDKGANKISIIGENKYSTVIKLVNNLSDNNQMIDIGGDCIIKNITFLNLHTGDGASYSNNPYCLHNDTPYEVDYKYSTVVKDCIMYSEMHTPIGAGLQDKQKQVYENVVCVYNGGGESVEGALYVHSQADANAEPCGLEVIGCRLISQNGKRCITLPSVHTGDYQSIPVTIRDCFGWTSGSEGHTLNPSAFNFTPDTNITAETFEINAEYDYPITP